MRADLPPDSPDLFATGETPPPWEYLDRLGQRLDAALDAVSAFRSALAEGDAALKERFFADEPVEFLVHDRAQLVDALLVHAWSRHAGKHASEIALLAVGGYGRGELLPCSDIDIMVLLPKTEASPWATDLERFLTFLWDIGLESATACAPSTTAAARRSPTSAWRPP